MTHESMDAQIGPRAGISPENANSSPESQLGRRLLLLDTEVAHLLQVPTDTIKNLHRTRALCGVKVGKHLRWRLCDVRTFVAALGGGEQ